MMNKRRPGNRSKGIRRVILYRNARFGEKNIHPCRYERVLKNLHSKEDDSSKFFTDFNPMCDRKTKKLRRRPRRKVVEEMKSMKDEDISEEPVNESGALNSVSEKASLYDSKGVLLHCGLDLCDCLEDSCPGCHLPCSNCSSPKCGHMCRFKERGLDVLFTPWHLRRSGRHWQYTSVVQDGLPGSKVFNTHLASMSP